VTVRAARGGDIMTAEEQTHAILIEAGAPAEVAVGAEFALKVTLTCAAGCDLSQLPLTITAPAGALVAAEPGVGENNAGEGARIVTLTAPLQVGEHVWRVSCAPHEASGVRHEACSSPVVVRTRPHQTSLAAWAIPSPVVTGQHFAIKAGAKSAMACDLNGRIIEVRDETGATIGRGTLGAAPWPGTAALYWAELELQAPPKAGMFSWSVRFDAAELEIPHEDAAASFSIAIVSPPEHRLTVKVFERETAAPIADAQVRLGAYRAATGPSGLAEIMMPKGTYDLNVWKVGYEAPASSVTIDADAAVEVAVAALPEENPDAAWQM
jgi:hypothetical protein